MMLSKILFKALVFLSLASPAFAEDVSKSMDSLGVNKDVVRKARKLNPNNEVRVVQKRSVDRTWRLEAGLGQGLISGGNPYTSSTQSEASLELHANPRWSFGARYFGFTNDLSREGERVFQNAQVTGIAPDIRDFAQNAYLGSVSYYPLYGKMNLFNLAVTQFDVYLSAGYGQIQLERSGSQDLLSFAGGIGFWLTNWLSTRFEIRYQTYEDTIGDNQLRRLDQTVFSAKIGFLL